MNSIFVLGAGFSAAAGLPLGKGLSQHILKLARQYERGGILLKDVERFVAYKNDTSSEKLAKDDVDFEEFVAFLDIEHSLGFEGSEHWSNSGNQSQLLIRNCIAVVLHAHQLMMTSEQKSLYDSFARRLDPGRLHLILRSV
ncbi:MAG: hypothetical protein GWP08_08415 [Nitrospiraceae bacterium]|nr:hypothetical protein [Nitrospiraceae bacterium]